MVADSGVFLVFEQHALPGFDNVKGSFFDENALPTEIQSGRCLGSGRLKHTLNLSATSQNDDKSTPPHVQPQLWIPLVASNRTWHLPKAIPIPRVPHFMKLLSHQCSMLPAGLSKKPWFTEPHELGPATYLGMVGHLCPTRGDPGLHIQTPCGRDDHVNRLAP